MDIAKSVEQKQRGRFVRENNIVESVNKGEVNNFRFNPDIYCQFGKRSGKRSRRSKRSQNKVADNPDQIRSDTCGKLTETFKIAECSVSHPLSNFKIIAGTADSHTAHDKEKRPEVNSFNFFAVHQFDFRQKACAGHQAQSHAGLHTVQFVGNKHKERKNKEYATKERYLIPDEIERLLKACLEFDLRNENYNYETYLFVLIALSTGARYSEIHNLRWENVDFIHRQFYFLNTKNGENRGVPMTNKVYEELSHFSKIRNIKSDYLWTTKNGEKLIDMRVRFYKVLECADIKECRFHDLRHTVASHIAMNGGSLLDIAQVTGHKTMQMVKRYAHLTKKHTADLLESTTSVMFQQVRG